MKLIGLDQEKHTHQSTFKISKCSVGKYNALFCQPVQMFCSGAEHGRNDSELGLCLQVECLRAVPL